MLKRSRRLSPYSPSKVLKDTLLPLVKESLTKKGFRHPHIILYWREIVGDYLADFTLPIKIHFSPLAQHRSLGILTIWVSSAVALEVDHSKEIIMERLNQYFGYRAIEKVRIKQGYSPPVKASTMVEKDQKKEEESLKLPTLSSCLEGVEDLELKHKLTALAIAMEQHLTTKNPS